MHVIYLHYLNTVKSITSPNTSTAQEDMLQGIRISQDNFPHFRDSIFNMAGTI